MRGHNDEATRTLKLVARALKLARELDERRSRYWTFKASKARSGGLYISREGTPGGAHVSLHYDQEWHLKVEGRYFDLRIADQIKVTGVRHAVSILIGKSACHVNSADARVETLVAEPNDDDVCLVLDLFMASQPGHVFGQTESGGLVPRWEIPLLDGQSAQILARVDRLPAGMTLMVDAPADTLEEIHAGVTDGSIDYFLILDSDERGPVRLLGTGNLRSTSPPGPLAHG